MKKKKMTKKQKKKLKSIIKKMKKIYKDIKKVDEKFCLLAQEVVFLDENAFEAFQERLFYEMPRDGVRNGILDKTRGESSSAK